MDRTNEAGRASTRRADSALGYLPATPITDLVGTDAKVVVLARHQTTIGSRTFSQHAIMAEALNLKQAALAAKPISRSFGKLHRRLPMPKS
jgi:hypothetical protein